MRKGLMVLVLLMILTPIKVQASELSVTDKGFLMLIAQAEAEGEGVEGKAAVMRVVLNRVESDRYPDTITEVIWDKGQFTTAYQGGRIFRVYPDDECREAVELIENGWDKTQGAIYFNSNNTPIGQYLLQIGNHKFYK